MKLRNKQGQFKKFSLIFKLKVKIESWYQKNKYLIAAFVWGLLVGSLIGFGFLNPHNTSPNALKKTIEVQAVGNTSVEKDWSTDLVGYFRVRGQQIGYDDYEITKLHGVMDCENGLHTADRVNYLYDGENGHYTAAGFAMITKSSFKHYGCTGDRFNGIDNINCFYRIIGKNKLNDYRESRPCWGAKFNVNNIYFTEVK